jgi:hypothetical protein
VLAVLTILALAAPVAAKPGGNDAGSAACANGGYLNWTTSTGAAFKYEGACTKYTAKGNARVAIVSVTAQYRLSDFLIAGVHTFYVQVDWRGLAPNTPINLVTQFGTFVDTNQLTMSGASGEGTVDSAVVPLIIPCRLPSGATLTAVTIEPTPSGATVAETYPEPSPCGTAPAP